MRLLVALVLILTASIARAQSCAPRSLPSINACTGQARVTMAIVGDVLLHRALAWRGYARGFDTLWGAASPLLRAADIAIANLEGPTAPGFTPTGRQEADPGPVFDDRVYSGYPQFNYHPSVIDGLREAGIDIVTTANNHALDRRWQGLDATLDALDARRMGHVGAVRSGETRFAPLRLRSRIGPLSLIGCTYDTNGIVDPHDQVPRCYRDASALVQLVAAERARGAAVIVLPHWGREYQHQPDGNQRRLAQRLAQAGATAIVGTHPHVVQPWEAIDAPHGATLTAYSTGNFVAAQTSLPRATSILAWLSLCQGARGPVVGGAGYVPLQMEFRGQHPSLTLPRPGGPGRADAGIALLQRLIPGRALIDQTVCTAPRPTAPSRIITDR